ncbi:MAG: O-antigen ligase family protein [Acidobacteriota bacterium]
MNSATSVFTPTSRISLHMFSLPSVVGFYFAARECMTYLFFTASPDLGAEVVFAISMALLLVAVFQSYGPATTRLSSALRAPALRWVLVFLGVSLLSLSWSVTVSRPIAFAYWLGMAADTATVLLLLRTDRILPLASRLLGGYVAGVCVIAIVMWLSPTMSDLRPGDDEFFSPNAIGFALGFGCFLAQYLLRTRPGYKWPAIFLAVSLLRSLSKTTILAFAIGQIVVLMRNKSLPKSARRNIILIALIILAVFAPLLIAYSDVYLNAGNQAVTLTGRIGIWGLVLERAIDNPWLGHGFHSFRHVIPAFGDFETWHAHNELVQQFYLYGIVGIVMLFGIYVSFYRQVRLVRDSALRALFGGLLLFVAIRGLADSERFDLSLPLWSIALLSLLLYQQRDAEALQW